MREIRKPRRNEPPLITEVTEEIDPVTGGPVKVTRHRRGVLEIESRSYKMLHPGILEPWTVKSRDSLEEFCNYLRDKLEECGLPSDRTPRWIKIGDDPWRSMADCEKMPDPPYSAARWSKRVNDLTEPLTIERAAAVLLESMLQLLARNAIDDDLWHIVQFANAFSDFRVVNRYNYPAYQGILARKARQNGPRTRQHKASQSRDIIWRHAERHWNDHPAYRGDASNTAAHIAAAVNDELTEKELLPAGRTGLSAKTISDYIRRHPGG